MITIKYTNSNGVDIDLIGANIMLTDGMFHYRKWKPITAARRFGERVNGFSMDPVSYKITATVRGSLEERYGLLDELTDLFDRDILTKTPGRITFGDHYIDGYMVESETKPNDTYTYWTDIELVFYCPYPFWIKEEEKVFNETADYSDTGLDYDYDYNYDYASYTSGYQKWTIDGYGDYDFLMTLYGPCTDPRVSIAGHAYKVNVSVAEGETVEINSREHTVTLVSGGSRSNIFSLRDTEQSVFEKIPAGDVQVLWNGDFRFTVKVFKERSEPRWS